MTPSTKPASSTALIGLGVLVVGIFMFTADLGGTVRGGLSVFMAGIGLVWLGPFWLLARFARTTTGRLLGGAVVLVATAWFLVDIFESEGSTSALGLIFVPVLVYPLTVAVLALDALLAIKATGDQLVIGMVKGTAAVALAFVAMVCAVMTFGGIAGLVDPGETGRSAASAVFTAIVVGIAVASAFAIRALLRPPRQIPRADIGVFTPIEK